MTDRDYSTTDNVSIIREVIVNYRTTTESQRRISGPHDVADLFRTFQIGNSREQLMTFYLDGSHQVIAFAITSIGTANMAIGHPREVFQPAILTGATAVILAHNHPSNCLEPSREDISLTERILDASAILGLRLLDHVIVGDFSHNSLKESGRVCFSGRTA